MDRRRRGADQLLLVAYRVAAQLAVGWSRGGGAGHRLLDPCGFGGADGARL